MTLFLQGNRLSDDFTPVLRNALLVLFEQCQSKSIRPLPAPILASLIFT